MQTVITTNGHLFQSMSAHHREEKTVTITLFRFKQDVMGCLSTHSFHHGQLGVKLLLFNKIF